MPPEQFDVCIVGDGPVGCAIAAGLQHSGLSIALAGEQTGSGISTSRPFRPIALSHSSRLILNRLGAWERLPVTPISSVHVSESGAFGQTRISRLDLNLPALGYVADYAEIRSQLHSRLDAQRVHLCRMDATPKAHLTVHAEGSPPEGADSYIRHYGYEAVVGSLTTDRAPHGVAFERFTPEGPLALLPFGKVYALVWSRKCSELPVEETALLVALQSAFGNRAGRFLAVELKGQFPLTLKYSRSGAVAGHVRVGNAAQTLHPVAGQGLNLGLRDAWQLVGRIEAAKDPQQLSGLGFAASYARSRKPDVLSVITITDLLATIFVRQDPLTKLLRRTALAGFDLVPPARRFLARRMVFGATAWP